MIEGKLRICLGRKPFKRAEIPYVCQCSSGRDGAACLGSSQPRKAIWLSGRSPVTFFAASKAPCWAGCAEVQPLSLVLGSIHCLRPGLSGAGGLQVSSLAPWKDSDNWDLGGTVYSNNNDRKPFL